MNQGRRLNNTKAVIDLSGETAAKPVPIAQTVNDAMVLNAATFADPPPQSDVVAIFDTLNKHIKATHR